jgi:hypothetical protein
LQKDLIDKKRMYYEAVQRSWILWAVQRQSLCAKEQCQGRVAEDD